MKKKKIYYPPVSKFDDFDFVRNYPILTAAMLIAIFFIPFALIIISPLFLTLLLTLLLSLVLYPVPPVLAGLAFVIGCGAYFFSLERIGEVTINVLFDIMLKLGNFYRTNFCYIEIEKDIIAAIKDSFKFNLGSPISESMRMLQDREYFFKNNSKSEQDGVFKTSKDFITNLLEACRSKYFQEKFLSHELDITIKYFEKINNVFDRLNNSEKFFLHHFIREKFPCGYNSNLYPHRANYFLNQDVKIPQNYNCKYDIIAHHFKELAMRDECNELTIRNQIIKFSSKCVEEIYPARQNAKNFQTFLACNQSKNKQENIPDLPKEMLYGVAQYTLSYEPRNPTTTIVQPSIYERTVGMIKGLF